MYTDICYVYVSTCKIHEPALQLDRLLCCSVLQCVAVCCSVLQCVAVCSGLPNLIGG